MKALDIEVMDSIAALQFEINELAVMVKVILMALGKIPLEVSALE